MIYAENSSRNLKTESEMFRHLEYENLTTSQRNLSQARQRQITAELDTANQNISRTEERRALIQKELNDAQNENNQLTRELLKACTEKEHAEDDTAQERSNDESEIRIIRDTTREKSRYDSEVRKAQNEMEDFQAKLVKSEVEATYHRDRSANQTGFITGPRSYEGIVEV